MIRDVHRTAKGKLVFAPPIYLRLEYMLNDAVNILLRNFSAASVAQRGALLNFNSHESKLMK